MLSVGRVQTPTLALVVERDWAIARFVAVPPAIAAPGTTAVWEQALTMIEPGQMPLDMFVRKQTAWVTQLVAQCHSATLSIRLQPAPCCPQCGSSMRERTGKRGSFWPFPRYPDCKGALPVDSIASPRGASRTRRHKAP